MTQISLRAYILGIRKLPKRQTIRKGGAQSRWSIRDGRAAEVVIGRDMESPMLFGNWAFLLHGGVIGFMKTFSERRESPKVPCSEPLDFTVLAANDLASQRIQPTVTVVDTSSGGMGLVTDKPLRLGTSCNGTTITGGAISISPSCAGPGSRPTATGQDWH